MSSTKVLGVLFALAAAAPVFAQDVKVVEEKPGLMKQAKLSGDSAIALAKAKMPKAVLTKAVLEEEDGKLIYSLVFKTAGKKGVDEVNVDAKTGKVGKAEHEDDEETDAKEEKAKAPKPTKKP